MAYIGNEPFPRGNFSATTHNGGTAVFTMGQSPGTKNAVLVFIDGVRQDPLNYSIAGVTLTLGTAAPAGTNNVQILVSGEELGVNVPADDSVTTAKILDDSVTTDKLANAINTTIAANTAKVTNATHTGDVTGATALTIAVDAVDIPMLSATGTADATTFLRGDNAWTAAGGLFSGYAIFCDQKTLGADGGTFTSGDWRVRDLNTTIANTDTTNIALGTNEFTLQAGNYYIQWQAVAGQPNMASHQSGLHDGSSLIQMGKSMYNWSTTGDSCGFARVTPGSATTYTIQHRCQTTTTNTGFGRAADFAVEIYTVVEIFKEA